MAALHIDHIFLFILFSLLSFFEPHKLKLNGCLLLRQQEKKMCSFVTNDVLVFSLFFYRIHV